MLSPSSNGLLLVRNLLTTHPNHDDRITLFLIVALLFPLFMIMYLSILIFFVVWLNRGLLWSDDFGSYRDLRYLNAGFGCGYFRIQRLVTDAFGLRARSVDGG